MPTQAAADRPVRSPEREWWLRAALVLQAPRPVFAALRDDSDEASEPRQEPLLAIVWLAGIAGVLATGQAGRLLDDYTFDGLIVAVWAFFGGGIYALAAYLLLGGLLYLGASLVGGLGSYRRARHVLGFAAVPIALSLVVWPVRLALFGADVFRRGGSDAGPAARALDLLDAAFLAWALALVVVGVMTVHGWGWARSAAAVALAAAPVVAVVALLTLRGGLG